MTTGAAPGAGTGGGEYRIEDLARHSGATVRTIRGYQDRGLLPRPGRRGRANVYDDSHLTRLRQIAGLLERGYTLASIKELLAAWDEGRGLGGVLDLLSEVDRPWTDEEPESVSRAELDDLFGEGVRSSPALPVGNGPQGPQGSQSRQSTDAVAEVVELGVLVPLPDRPGHYLVPSPQELTVAAELHKAGVPLLAVTEHLRELRAQVEHIAARFVDLTNEHIFVRYLHDHPSDEDASEAAALIRRLRPLAKQTVDAELARAMRSLASRNLREHFRRAAEAGTAAGAGQRTRAAVTMASDSTEQVRLPAGTLAAVRNLVGTENAAAFVAAAAEREVQARAMDSLAVGPHGPEAGKHRPGTREHRPDTREHRPEAGEHGPEAGEHGS